MLRLRSLPVLLQGLPFALRNSESADYNIEKPETNSKFDESAYFTDDYLEKAKAKRKAEHAANEVHA